jgi:hypothetical protein
MKLAAIGLSVLAILACAGTTRAASPDVPTTQDEPRYPLAGAFFTGSADALAKLKDFAQGKGFTLEIVTLPDGNQQLPIPPALLTGKAFIEIFNEAQSGRLGKFDFAIVSGPAPALK